ncbi:hypothetical protein FK268_15620 [Tsukamurella sputi]|uniref:Uncharacterized protein n=1 Tax=Tsukamurella sputi TaxID=2591848 RepID=A0A5C5RL38_9ACTN|nr:hypothetical protein [Tsukamurella sputi]TWS23686.1 hypothetical protein FK268_15620 [Tsukamurella sputi]
MKFTKVGIVLIATLCAAVVVCGVGLWIIESRLAAAHPECVGTGSARATLTATVGENGPRDRVLDRVLTRLGCPESPSPQRNPLQ